MSCAKLSRCCFKLVHVFSPSSPLPAVLAQFLLSRHRRLPVIPIFTSRLRGSSAYPWSYQTFLVRARDQSLARTSAMPRLDFRLMPAKWARFGSEGAQNFRLVHFISPASPVLSVDALAELAP